MVSKHNKSLFLGLIAAAAAVFGAGCSSQADKGTVVRESPEEMKQHEQTDAANLKGGNLPPQVQMAAAQQRELAKRAALTTQKNLEATGQVPRSR